MTPAAGSSDGCSTVSDLHSRVTVCLCVLSGPNRGHYITIVKSHGFWLLFDDDIVEVRHSHSQPALFCSLFLPSPKHSSCLCRAENRRPGDRGVLRAYLRHLQELRVGIHPLLPVQGVRRSESVTLEKTERDCLVQLIPVTSILCCSQFVHASPLSRRQSSALTCLLCLSL